MTTYFTATIDMTTVAREIANDRAYDELFNELANQFIHPEDILPTLEKHCGSELEDEGKALLFAIADFVDRQFPGERKKGDE
jgi:hypothetical protein